MRTHNRSDEEKLKIVNEIIEYRQKGLTIQKACQKVGISDCSFYQWKKQLVTETAGNPDKSVVHLNHKSQKDNRQVIGPVKATKIKAEDRERILEIKSSFPHMGVKQLRQHLIRNHKLIYSERQIRQFLESEGVPKMKTAFPPQPVRRFERDQPNEMWQIDIMNFFVGSIPLYLCSFLDDHSRFIVSYTISEEQTSNVILELLKRAISFRKPLSIITDRGIQFSSWNGVTQFQLELRAHGIDHLLAREQHPETMGKIEAFHKSIKRELLTTTEFSDIQEAKERIHDYIMFYNFARPHMGIDNQAPAERFFKKLRPYNLESVYYRQVVPNPGIKSETQRQNQKTGATAQTERAVHSEFKDRSKRFKAERKVAGCCFRSGGGVQPNSSQ